MAIPQFASFFYFYPTDNTEIRELEEDLKICEVADRKILFRVVGLRAHNCNSQEIADRLANVQNFDWHPIEVYVAEIILKSALQFGLAYSSRDHPHMTRSDAEDLTRRFLGFFSQRASFFSNGDSDADEESMSGSRGSVVDATFDKGVVVVDGDRAGILWYSDED